MPDDKKIGDVHTITDWEIFSEGVWNGIKITAQDIDDLVDSFSATRDKLKPFLKLGHDGNQKLLQKDGLPAAGWVTSLKKVGKKLLATVEGIPTKIFNLITKRAYGRVSSEVFFDINIEGKKFRRALKAVALLGGNTPAVTNLDDFIDLYGLTKDYIVYDNDNNYKTIVFEQGAKSMAMEKIEITTEEFTELKKSALLLEPIQDENTRLKQEVNSFSEKNTALAQEVESLNVFKQKYEDSQKEMFENEVESFFELALKDKKFSPADGEFYKSQARKSEGEFEVWKNHIDKMVENSAEFAQSSIVGEVGSAEESDDAKLERVTNEKIAEFAKQGQTVSYREAQQIAFDELHPKKEEAE